MKEAKHRVTGDGYNKTKAFSYLSKVSNEKKLQSKHILEEIKNLKDTKLLLDLGAGSGDILNNIFKKFNKTVAIEPGDKMFNLLQNKFKNYSNLNLLNLKWEDFYKKFNKQYKNKFDLIILVHSIYFFENKEKELQKIYNLLKLNGKIIIIIGAPNDKHKFIRHFRQKHLYNNITQPNTSYDWIQNNFDKVKTKEFKSKIKISNFDILEKIHKEDQKTPSNYFLKFAIKKWFDELSSEEIKEIKEYIQEYEKIDKNGNYIITGIQKIFIITK